MTPPLSVREALAAFAKASSDYNKAEDAEPGYIHRPPEWWSARHDEAESALIAVVRHDLLTGNVEGPWFVQRYPATKFVTEFWKVRHTDGTSVELDTEAQSIAVRNSLNALEAR